MAGILIEQKVAIGQYKHLTKKGAVTVPGKPNDDLATGTMASILEASTTVWSK